ncbi:PH domain-containing protein [Natronococcus wangiae]|uniref:PH domain-containing protein n=1 Tax=Natronococcus wangiae TaxID=3068275 RepID=UPI00274001F2|nr:PH domain-containing protein [Natronococcus sp. AD5]
MSLKALVRPRENVEDASWLHLTEDEHVRWSERPSRFTIVFALAVGLVFALVGIVGTAILMSVLNGWDLPTWVGYLPLVFTILGVVIAGMTYLRWLRLLYVITDEEIYVKYGLISRDVTQVRLDRVQNTAYDQSILERVLSFGDVRIYTAGTSTEDITFRDVPNPERVTSTLTQLLSEQHSGNDRENPLSP